MAHYTQFRPFHQYHSFYPYYLPSYYSRIYPKHYERYFEPTEYWVEKHQPIIQEIKETTKNSYSNNSKVINYILLSIFILLIMYILVFMR
jgi:hypothetical protein